MKPWEHPPPPVLYKYLPPQRLHVLTDCRVRFSQRIVFEDDHELQPDYAIFGTASEIWRYAISIGFPLSRGGLPASVVVAAMAGNPKMQKIGIESLQKNIRVRDELGIFALPKRLTLIRCGQSTPMRGGASSSDLIHFTMDLTN